MNSVFAITCNKSTNPLLDLKLFSTREKAKAALTQIKIDRKNKIGVHVLIDTQTKFSFLLGWEEVEVSFYIVELAVE